MWLLIFLVVLVVGILLVREFFGFWLPFAVATNLVSKGKKEPAIRLFRKIMEGSPLLSATVQGEARYRLSWLMMEKGNYEDAVTLLREMLKRRQSKATESNVRQRL
ncbi:MAG: tetratricopeptide repeat protein, partial [Chthonomonadaceae bacterium]|nr:tetratricopeptide repeat protein [Chthonomonadaceae bacterium]